ITGATGFLGGHIAEQLVARGERVRALVRPMSDVAFLRGLGVELAEGDLGDAASLRPAVAGADVVYHCAAKVGEWGPWSEYQALIIDATRILLDACRAGAVGRFLHVSSITVYGHPQPRPGEFTEDEPLAQNLWRRDYYIRAKVRAEELVRAYPGAWTILRPSWIYGPRDRNTLPRLVKALRSGRISLIGSGENLLNIVYVADVAEAAILAANSPAAVGRAYNVSSPGEVTQRQVLDTVTDLLGLPRVRRRMPFWLAFRVGWLSELIGRAIRLKRPPHATRYGVSLVGRPTQFSIARARAELGWQPRVHAVEGLRRTLEWFRESEGMTAPPEEDRAAPPVRSA
ncbi:MAG TPA: NAD-dependent epimerase/dehydratase family protein, partial [Gemmataceae bacterium]|nr:NAD-dependent epimerase/dehydratase family protein [Gemmataceae bacterium]